MAKKERAFELDFLRGIAIVMMILMHFSYDMTYEFGLDGFDFISNKFFWEFIHPIILVLFVGVSGICCSFSRNNSKRGLRLLAVAVAFSLVTLFITNVVGVYCLIIFNVLHMLALSTLLYAFMCFIESKTGVTEQQMTLIMLMIGVYIIILNNKLYYYDGSVDSMLLYPIGFDIPSAPAVADYMPVIPWMGVFITCAALGRILYKDRKTLFPGRSDTAAKFMSPFEFLGRHSLIIYLVHQPLMYGVLYLILMLAGKI